MNPVNKILGVKTKILGKDLSSHNYTAEELLNMTEEQLTPSSPDIQQYITRTSTYQRNDIKPRPSPSFIPSPISIPSPNSKPRVISETYNHIPKSMANIRADILGKNKKYKFKKYIY